MKKFIFAITMLLCYNVTHAADYKAEYTRIKDGMSFGHTYIVKLIDKDHKEPELICFATSVSNGLSCNWEAYNKSVDKDYEMKKALINLQAAILSRQVLGKAIEKQIEEVGTFNAEEEKEFDKAFPDVYDVETLK